MSTGSPSLERREQAIEAARRRLRRLEIEQHRIKAALARLEADYEDDVADWLSRKVRRRLSPVTHSSVAGVSDAGRIKADGKREVDRASRDLSFVSESASKAARRAEAGPTIAFDLNPNRTGAEFSRREDSKPEATDSAAAPCVKPDETTDAPSRGRGRKSVRYRAAASPLICSLAIHVLALALCLTVTVATIVRQQIPIFSSPADLDEAAVEEFANVEIPPTKFEDAELRNVVYESEEFNLADNPHTADEPARVGVGTHALGDVGQLDALPSELGSLMAGAGSPGSGAPGGPAGEAIFFGARSKGDRFVFVVDNSSSMKGGRLEAATAELLNAVRGLSPRQSFYVIFVSDQTYPMFFPQSAVDLVPATPVNLKRLAEWLPNAILASGNNRQMIKAMDMAAALRPHAVFMLWDGDMKYSEKVRLDVMTHLTRPNQWNFAIHTIGMGVTSLDAEQNLTTIARAHGGTFRRVDVPAGR